MPGQQQAQQQTQQGGGDGFEKFLDIGALMKDSEQRDAQIDKYLGEELTVVHNATGPWFAWQDPTFKWHEDDKIGGEYNFWSDDVLVTYTLGNDLSQLIFGFIMGIGDTSNADKRANTIINRIDHEADTILRVKGSIYAAEKDGEDGKELKDKFIKYLVEYGKELDAAKALDELAKVGAYDEAIQMMELVKKSSEGKEKDIDAKLKELQYKMLEKGLKEEPFDWFEAYDKDNNLVGKVKARKGYNGAINFGFADKPEVAAKRVNDAEGDTVEYGGARAPIAVPLDLGNYAKTVDVANLNERIDRVLAMLYDVNK